MLMKFCLCASTDAAPQEPVLYRKDYAGLFDYAKELGVEGVEIHLRSAIDVDAEALKRDSEHTGVALAAIATGLAKRIDGLDLTDSNEACRKKAIDRVKAHIELANRFGCRIIIGSMRGNIRSPDQDRQTRERLGGSMCELAECLKTKNCSIVFEAINRYENNYLNTAAETVEFVKTLGSPQISVLLDTFHMNIEEQNMADAIRATGAYLGHIHIADNNRLYPGNGSIDFSAVFRALRDIRYSGWVSLEYLPGADEKTAASRGLRYVRSLWNCLQKDPLRR